MPASPELTGGSGFTYENAVAAFYLTSVFTEGTPLGLSEAVATAVRLQRGETGRPLDDLIVEALGADGTASIDLQVTTTLALTAGNEKFGDIIARAWKTLKRSEFDDGRDRVGFVVRTVGEQSLQDLRFLCDAARRATDADDFAGGRAAFSQSKNAILAAIGQHIRDNTSGKGDAHDVWRLIRSFVPLRLQLIGATATDRHAAIERLRGRLTPAEVDRAGDLWARLVQIAAEAQASGGSIDRPLLERELSASFALTPARSFRADIERLSAETAFGLASIRDRIDGEHIVREAPRERTIEARKGNQLIHLTGRPGTGKSVVLKDVANALSLDGTILVLKADRLVEGGWPGFRNRHGLATLAPADLLQAMSLGSHSTLLIDGIDRIAPAHRAIVTELVEAMFDAAGKTSWSVITTVRTGSIADLRHWFPIDRFRTIKEIEVDHLSDAEAEALATSRPSLRELLFGHEAVRDLARRPFFLSVLAALTTPEGTSITRETDLARAWWSGGGHDSEGASRRARQSVLLALARQGARTMGRRMLASEFSPEAVEGLVRDDVLTEQDDSLRLSFAHDIFFEWAFYHVLMEADDGWPAELVEAGEPPALGRPVELLSARRLTEYDVWSEQLLALETGNVRSQWLRSWLLGPFLVRPDPSDDAFKVRVLLENEGVRLERLLTWFLATRTAANPGFL